MQRSFYKVKKDLNIHIYTYISIYLYISVYIYIEKKNEGWAMGMCSFQKNAKECCRCFKRTQMNDVFRT